MREEIFWEKNAVSKTIVGGSRRLPNILNPLWYIFCFARNKGRNQASENMEIAMRISYVVNGLSKEEKKLLTVHDENVTITPQQSFVDFFKLQNLLTINPAEFIQGFICLFNKNKDK